MVSFVGLAFLDFLAILPLSHSYCPATLIFPPFSLLILNLILPLFLASSYLTVFIVFVWVSLGELRDRSVATIFFNSVETSTNLLICLPLLMVSY